MKSMLIDENRGVALKQFHLNEVARNAVENKIYMALEIWQSIGIIRSAYEQCFCQGGKIKNVCGQGEFIMNEIKCI